jgi:hypothetical protein
MTTADPLASETRGSDVDPSSVSPPLVTLELVELGAKALALSAAMLPFVGYGTRYVSFLLDPTLRNVLQLTTAAPLLEATALGLFTLLGPAAIFALIYFLAVASISVSEERDAIHSEHGRQQAAALALRERVDALAAAVDAHKAQTGDPQALVPPPLVQELHEIQELTRATGLDVAKLEARANAFARTPLNRPVRIASRLGLHPKVTDRLVVVVSVLLILVSTVLLPGFPSALVMIAGAMLASIAFRRRVRERAHLRLRNAWPALAILLVSMTIGQGLIHAGNRPGTYSFVSGSPALQDGQYGELGRSDLLVFVRPCDHPQAGYFAVPETRISLVAYAPPDDPRSRIGPSLAQVLFDRAHIRLGASSQCPAAP